MDKEFAIGIHQPLKIRHWFASKVLMGSLVNFVLLAAVCCLAALEGSKIQKKTQPMWMAIGGGILIEFAGIALVAKIWPQAMQRVEAGYALLALFYLTEFACFAAVSMEIGSMGYPNLVYASCFCVVKVVFNLFLASLQTRFDISGIFLWIFAFIMSSTSVVILEFMASRGSHYSFFNVAATGMIVMPLCFTIVFELQSLFTTNRMYWKFKNPLFLYSIDSHVEAATQVFTAPVRLVSEPPISIAT